MSAGVIETDNLQLAPYAPEHLIALIDGTQQFESRFGLPPADGLREFFVSDDISPAWLEQLRASAAADVWVHGFAVVQRESRSVIGAASFKGAPDAEGVVEIAYGIVPDCQGRGYATEAAQALVAFAFADSRVRRVRAHTLPNSNASTRVLTKCGFHRIGEFVDPEDGPVWRWDRPRGQWPTTADGKLAMYSRHLDLDGLLRDVSAPGTAAHDVDDPPKDM